MASFNKVVLMGNLTKKPELREVGDSQVCNMSMAINKSYINKQTDEKVNKVTFVEISAWGKTAENAAKYLDKGSPVLIEGSLQMQTWKDKTSGGNRSKLSVRAVSVQFLGSKPDAEKPAEAPDVAEEQSEVPF